MFLAGLLTNTLLKRYSTRSVGIIGALFFALTSIVLAFVRNIYEMAFIYFIQGFGFGLIVTVTNTIFNSYFVKKRAKVKQCLNLIKNAEYADRKKFFLLFLGHVCNTSHYCVGRNYLSYVMRKNVAVVWFSR